MNQTCCRAVAVALAVLVCLCSRLVAADWPAYKADGRRSSVTPEELAFPLAERWSYKPRQSPRPAWPEPGKELNRVDFDYAYQPVAAGGLVYFGSSADDTVRALRAETGELVWRFTADGPVRFAPALARGSPRHLPAEDSAVLRGGFRAGGDLRRGRPGHPAGPQRLQRGARHRLPDPGRSR